MQETIEEELLFSECHTKKQVKNIFFKSLQSKGMHGQWCYATTLLNWFLLMKTVPL